MYAILLVALALEIGGFDVDKALRVLHHDHLGAAARVENLRASVGDLRASKRAVHGGRAIARVLRGELRASGKIKRALQLVRVPRNRSAVYGIALIIRGVRRRV